MLNLVGGPFPIKIQLGVPQCKWFFWQPPFLKVQVSLYCVLATMSGISLPSKSISVEQRRERAK